MCLIFNRTEFGDKPESRSPIDFLPPSLIRDDEKTKGRSSNIPKVSFSTMLERALGPE